MVSYSKFLHKGKILMLALDHRGSFSKLINPKSPDSVEPDLVVKIKGEIINSVYKDFSGVLIDSSTGLPAFEKVAALKKEKKPYLLCIEKTGYEERGESQKTELEFTVEELKKYGTSGVKLLLYYHPQSSTKEHQQEVGRKVLAACQKSGLPLFLELVTYPIKNENNNKPEMVLDSVKQFVQAGIIPDVFKLEYPGDPAACFDITKLLKKTPWILLTKGDSYQNFCKQLTIATNNGCQGFLAGRSLWQEFAQYPESKRLDFFESVVSQRFSQIARIVTQ